MNFVTLKEIAGINVSLNKEKIMEKIKNSTSILKDHIIFIQIRTKSPFDCCNLSLRFRNDIKEYEAHCLCLSAEHRLCSTNIFHNIFVRKILEAKEKPQEIALETVDIFEKCLNTKVCKTCFCHIDNCTCEQSDFLIRDVEEKCPICLNNLPVHSLLLPCKHELCHKCYIDLVLIGKNNCPLCRAILCDECEEERLMREEDEEDD
jgi:hypothetical protein